MGWRFSLMKINWIQHHANWAFGNLCSHLRKKMPNREHVIDKTTAGGINVVCSPHFLRGRKAGSTTICRLDSNRWYDHLITEKKK